jgi:bifunctional ADP-heptose synthase (sugar kinase/adenylyltransferase)
MFDFEEALKLIATQTILCVGDLMLDDFVYGDVAGGEVILVDMVPGHSTTAVIERARIAKTPAASYRPASDRPRDHGV